jgi:hypothetical protein
VGAGLTLGKLPVDAALNQIDTRLKAENRIRQADRTGILAFKGGDLQFHLTHPPHSGFRGRSRSPASGTCPAWRFFETTSSPRRLR